MRSLLVGILLFSAPLVWGNVMALRLFGTARSCSQSVSASRLSGSPLTDRLVHRLQDYDQQVKTIRREDVLEGKVNIQERWAQMIQAAREARAFLLREAFDFQGASTRRFLLYKFSENLAGNKLYVQLSYEEKMFLDQLIQEFSNMSLTDQLRWQQGLHRKIRSILAEAIVHSMIKDVGRVNTSTEDLLPNNRLHRRQISERMQGHPHREIDITSGDGHAWFEVKLFSKADSFGKRAEHIKHQLSEQLAWAAAFSAAGNDVKVVLVIVGTPLSGRQLGELTDMPNGDHLEIWNLSLVP